MILLDIGGASVNLGLWAFYILLGVAVASAFLLPLLNLTMKSLTRIGISILMTVVAVVISYAFANGEMNDLSRSFGMTETSLRLADSGLLIFTGLLIISIILIIYSELRNLFVK